MRITLFTDDSIKINDYVLKALVLLYLPCESFGEDDNHGLLFANIESDGKFCSCYVKIELDGKKVEHKIEGFDLSILPDFLDKPKNILERTFIYAAEKLFGYIPEWGILTGIRPAKRASQIMLFGFSKEQTKEILQKHCLVNEKKAELCIKISELEERLCGNKEEKSCSLYVSIPFCPTKCKYCSFVSFSTDRLLSMIPDYLLRLESDLKLISQTIKDLGLSLKTVYVGGGTPSILESRQIESLLYTLSENFDLPKLLEFTFEAGRPDTVTSEKLSVLKKYGVDRVSINTQSTNNEILKNVGRNHTFEDYKKAYYFAREVGFSSINTDLIAGLPGESFSSFKRSIEDVISLSPENITVHSFTLKKSSEFKYEEYNLHSTKNVSKMLNFAYSALDNSGYYPYYIYRQKNTAENLENIGYSKKGFEGLYNIYMMEEYHTVFSAGAGAVTKLVSDDRSYITRLFNPKYPYEYLRDNKYIYENQDKIKSYYHNDYIR